MRIIYLLDVYNKIHVGVQLLPLGNQEIQDGDQCDINKMLFTTFSKMRSMMVLLVLCKDVLFA